MTGRRHAGFHPLVVAAVERLTDEAVAVTFDVPPELADVYAFLPGQHVALRAPAVGDEVRRTYSICSPAPDGRLRVAVKWLPGGAFSSYALQRLRPGESLEVLPPSGGFTLTFDARRRRHYCAIAAGSGITPILSLLATALALEPASRCTLLYVNRTASSVMFADELADLKDRYLQRVHLLHVLSREDSDSALLSGRLDRPKLDRILDTVLPAETVDEWLLCGPALLMEDAQAALAARGVDRSRIHRELFHLGSELVPTAPGPGTAADRAQVAPHRPTRVSVVLDGRTSTVESAAGVPVLDAALTVRPELPYSCRNGMCGTCRAKLVAGEVVMDHNYALEEDERSAGFVLTCQARPTSSAVTVDFDA